MENYKEHTAAHNGDYETVKLAIENNSKFVSAKDDSGRTLLHWACVGGHLQIVELLLERGADINNQDETGWTPVMCAACAGRFEVVQFLVGQNADLNKTNDGGHSALQYAASKNHAKVVAYLLEAGADINKRDVRGATALHRAASQGHMATVEVLISKSHCDLNPTNSEGNTPLHLCCEEERTECARLLLSHGADDTIRNKEGRTPKEVIPEPLPTNHIPGLGKFYPS